MDELRRGGVLQLQHLSSIVLAFGMMQHPIPHHHVQPIVESFCTHGTVDDRREVRNSAFAL